MRLRTLLLLRWLLTHLHHLALTHELSIVLLVVGGGPSRIHMSVLLGHDLLLLRCVRLLLMCLLLRSLLLILHPLLGSSSIAIGAIGDNGIVLIRSLVVIVHRRVVRSRLLLLLLLLLLLGSANPGSGVHRVLTHLTRRLGLML